MHKFIDMYPTSYSPMAMSGGRMYNLPFNMNTFSRIWEDVRTPAEAMEKIEREREEIKGEPQNLEEQAISMVGRTVYEKLVKGYTEKQWGRDCKELPKEIIRRLPIRFEYRNTYFDDKYIGIPNEGYNGLFGGLLKGVDVSLNTDFFEHREELENLADKVVFTGRIDEYFNFKLGRLEYRSLDFVTKIYEGTFQGCAVVNHCDHSEEYTRTIEHKFFEKGGYHPETVVSFEYPKKFEEGAEPYYPVNDLKNEELYGRYKELADTLPNVIFGGRLGAYKYYDMDDVISEALILARNEKKRLKNGNTWLAVTRI